MGSCCCRPSPEKDEEEEKTFSKGGSNDLSNGPAGNRGCTDAWCLLVLLAAWGAYIFVTMLGFADGNPSKLYLPRDYSGAYCDVESNWNDGLNLKGFRYLSYTMNATSTTDLIVKQLLCSSAASDALVYGTFGVPPILTTAAEKNDYLCECCLSPCAKCEGSLDTGGDLTASNLQGTISSKMNDLKGATKASNLFSPGGANGDVFTNMWSEATKYFNTVCLPDCNTNFDSINGSTGEFRNWTYTMADDNGLKPYWEALKESGPANIKDTINSQFTFKALPPSLCPYNESKCIPMPGVKFGELANGYCSFEMASDVVDALGSAASGAFAAMGGEAFQDSATETFGKWVGDFERSILAFVLVSICSFAIGFIFLVLLRFFIGICVWFAIILVLFVFALGGGVCYVRSMQCAGSDLFSTGQEMAVAVAVAGSTAATNVVSGSEAVSEDMTGNGADYRGVQAYTKSGLKCANWGEGNAAAYSPAAYSDSGLTKNFCRNPYNVGDVNQASTIWCFTTDTTITWQSCSPVGVISPVCSNGYAVSSPDIRVLLEIGAYILWVLGGIYLLLVICLNKRIRLAIAVNKVAATFVGHTPLVLVIPIVQAFVGILWIALWALSASFLISQVPADYTPTGAYSTYAEAYGTATVPGKCNDKWPTGSVFRDEDDCDIVNGTAACWKCYPPRYIFDWRFGVSFFVYLWNIALNLAMGQCIIAGACGVWFFTVNSEKGKKAAIRQSCWNVFRYHLGSLAFGSFIIAVIQFIRYLMKYYEKQAKAAKNRVMVLILKVGQCCIWCLEKCVKFLNKNAYIQIALMGTNFCVSAKKAFFLILRNALRFGAVGMLSAGIHAIGFLFIVASTVGLGYLILTSLYPDVAPAVCLIIYGFTAYLVAKLFMNVFGLAVDTTLQCFLACEEMGLHGDFVPSAMSGWIDSSKPLDADDKDGDS
eukprot:gb/GFBE01020666.1/.p1 GENE.gb/GFBE01020666.1/~~gb/GFBE01020666.1/.p1  ORF type:complete len:937 (+),score=214.71 gb/GFBE01020666.1/:1-2811(+)